MSEKDDDKGADDGTGTDAGSGSGADGDDDDDLLGDEAKNGGKGDDDKDGDKGKGKDDDKKSDPPLTKADLTDVVTAAVAEANRVADRRINEVLDKRLGKDGEKGKAKDDDDTSTADTAAALGSLQREARLSFKEYLDGEDITFLGNEERTFAADLGKALIESRREIDDAEIVGREVAKVVAEQVRGLRKFYEKATKNALKRRGLLKDDGKGQQAAASGTGGVGTGSDMDKGAAKAAAMFGGEKKAS